MKILLISNMYPSKEQVYYGSFIKNIEEGLLLNKDVKIDKIVIAGRGIGVVGKIIKYIFFYAKILVADFGKYDFVHLSYPSHTYLPLIFKKQTNLLVRLHGLDLVSGKEERVHLFAKYFKVFTKLAISRATLCIVPSEYFKKELDKFDKAGNVKDIYVYPSGGVSFDKFYPLSRDDNNVFTIGYVGRIDRLKGVDILINAFDLLNITAKLIIVGDGVLLDDMKKMASESSKNRFITFTGPVPNEKLIYHYNRFDLFVFPTMRKGESFGNVAIESMACGTPIVGSKMAGLQDYIYDGQNGFFFQPGDKIDLASKINKFYDQDTYEKRKMSDFSLKIAKSYEREFMSRSFYEYLKKL